MLSVTAAKNTYEVALPQARMLSVPVGKDRSYREFRKFYRLLPFCAGRRRRRPVRAWPAARPAPYLVVRINKPLSCLYQHGPPPGQLTNYVPEMILFIEKNLLEPLYSSGVYLSLLPVRRCVLGRRVGRQEREGRNE
jgi:hypothetical protein